MIPNNSIPVAHMNRSARRSHAVRLDFARRAFGAAGIAVRLRDVHIAGVNKPFELGWTPRGKRRCDLSGKGLEEALKLRRSLRAIERDRAYAERLK